MHLLITYLIDRTHTLHCVFSVFSVSLLDLFCKTLYRIEIFALEVAVAIIKVATTAILVRAETIAL